MSSEMEEFQERKRRRRRAKRLMQTLTAICVLTAAGIGASQLQRGGLGSFLDRPAGVGATPRAARGCGLPRTEQRRNRGGAGNRERVGDATEPLQQQSDAPSQPSVATAAAEDVERDPAQAPADTSATGLQASAATARHPLSQPTVAMAGAAAVSERRSPSGADVNAAPSRSR